MSSPEVPPIPTEAMQQHACSPLSATTAADRDRRRGSSSGDGPVSSSSTAPPAKHSATLASPTTTDLNSEPARPLSSLSYKTYVEQDAVGSGDSSPFASGTGPQVTDTDHDVDPAPAVGLVSAIPSTPLDDDRTFASHPPTPAPEDPDSPRKPLPEQLDIEHLEVVDDPRAWSARRKNLILVCIAFNAAGGQLSASIYFPALDSLQADLKASDQLLAASVSLFILGQGVFPVFWSALSEIKGRKTCYIAAILIYLVATTVCSRAEKIGVFVAMRVLQSLGSGAVLALGAGTLSDIFDVHERGTKIGFFYGVPLLAPSLGPLLGGALTEAGSWRTTFYFLIGYGVICLSTMIWLPETFRRERSLAWRLAMKRARAHAKADLLRAQAKLPQPDTLPTIRAPVQTSFAPTPQRENGPTMPTLSKVMTALSGRSADDNVKIHLRDVNPFGATGAVLRQKNNFIAIAFSGVLFASTYCITFTVSRTFAEAPYNYNALKTGLVLLCFGTGNFIGSVGGGRYSDFVFNTLKAKNGGKGSPEMRIKSTRVAMMLVPPLYIVYAWTVQKHTSVAGPLIALFLLGTSTMVLYSSLLSYVVDANPGRSSSAVACNSLFRGVLAAIASQVAEPIIHPIGNGWFYTGFAVILILGELALLVVGAKGQRWREQQLHKAEMEKEQEKMDEKSRSS